MYDIILLLCMCRFLRIFLDLKEKSSINFQEWPNECGKESGPNIEFEGNGWMIGLGAQWCPSLEEAFPGVKPATPGRSDVNTGLRGKSVPPYEMIFIPHLMLSSKDLTDDDVDDAASMIGSKFEMFITSRCQLLFDWIYHWWLQSPVTW